MIGNLLVPTARKNTSKCAGKKAGAFWQNARNAILCSRFFDSGRNILIEHWHFKKQVRDIACAF